MAHVILKMNAKKEEVHLQALVQKDTAFVVPVSIICEIHTYIDLFTKNT